GPLWDVPFAALPVPGRPGKVSWEFALIAIAPGAAALAAARAARVRPGRVVPRGELLIVADPEPGGGSNPSLPRLPYARVEADAIHSVFPRSTTRVGAKAEEAGVLAEVAGYRRLHFATHAVMDEASPLLGGIVLGRGKGGDGLLTAREWMGLDLAAELLVLSACGSGRGRTVAGEGIVGIAWAAFLSGIPAQVVSQWSVDDAATAQLMAGFYGRLRLGARVDAALREAALELRSRPGFSHPFHWAPFIALGDVWSV
ncbi:MAG: CHAT domain-containing protein, partial [Armatimonadota bacterium]